MVVSIPAPLTEFIKVESVQNPIPNNSSNSQKMLQASSINCESNPNFLTEDRKSYRERLRSVKWKNDNHGCDARFRIGHIKASQEKMPFHHMSFDAALEPSKLTEWAKVIESESDFAVSLIPTPFSFETLGTKAELGQLYARRIWKLASLIGQENISEIILSQNQDNSKIVAATITELQSPSRKYFGDEKYKITGDKIKVVWVEVQTSRFETLTNLAHILQSKGHKLPNSLADVLRIGSEGDPTALVITALNHYFSEFQRIDFSRDSQPERMLKSVNNGVKTVQLIRILGRIVKSHPEVLRKASTSALKKLSAMFAPKANAIAGDGEVDQLSRLMAVIPNIVLSEFECRDITTALLNVLYSEGGGLENVTLEELLTKTLASLSPVITELAIESLNGLLVVQTELEGEFHRSTNSLTYSAPELNYMFLDGIDLSSQADLNGMFLEVNVLFARLKEFYLRAYQGLLLYGEDVAPSSRSPAAESEGPSMQIEEVITASNCPIQKYRFSTRVFDSTEAQVIFKTKEPFAPVAIPVARGQVDQPLSIDSAKIEIESQLAAAANSFPLIMATSGSGQLEQLLAVLSQQSISLADILKNTKFNGRSNFYLQMILSPEDVFNLNEAKTGTPFPVPVSKLLTPNGDPLCDARNVILVLDYLFTSDGQVSLNLQWGMHLPRHFQQGFSEFTKVNGGIIVKNKAGKPDKIHISDFQLMPSKGKDRSHFALLTVSASGKLGISNVSANLKFGPQMSLLFERQFVESDELDFTKKQNVMIETPFYADLFSGPLKNSKVPPLEILWSVGRAQGTSLVKGNVCTENETFGPLLNLNKAYPEPLQTAFNQLGMYNVLMHSGKARLDELGLELQIDPNQMGSEDYTPSLKLNKLELQVFPYNMEGNYYPEKDRFNLINPKAVGSSVGISSGESQRVMLNLGHWLCFPLPHNKETQIMKGLAETLNTRMPGIWARARNVLNQIKSLMGTPNINASDVEKIDTDNLPETKEGA
jgi:hypothetical protein